MLWNSFWSFNIFRIPEQKPFSLNAPKCTFDLHTHNFPDITTPYSNSFPQTVIYVPCYNQNRNYCRDHQNPIFSPLVYSQLHCVIFAQFVTQKEWKKQIKKCRLQKFHFLLAAQMCSFCVLYNEIRDQGMVFFR